MEKSSCWVKVTASFEMSGLLSVAPLGRVALRKLENVSLLSAERFKFLSERMWALPLYLEQKVKGLKEL